ncbi:hypothetical protein [Tropicimonas sp. S265A]|uniref:hypothetical protein n=1 Tax=Tropicimonas sp. S265A TaxID=3415134 RepID=UPI003C79C204
MNFHWLMRMSQWVRHPPSPQRVKFVLAIIAICGAIWGIELIFGWPEALTPNQVRPRPTGF